METETEAEMAAREFLDEDESEAAGLDADPDADADADFDEDADADADGDVKAESGKKVFAVLLRLDDLGIGAGLGVSDVVVVGVQSSDVVTVRSEDRKNSSRSKAKVGFPVGDGDFVGDPPGGTVTLATISPVGASIPHSDISK